MSSCGGIGKRWLNPHEFGVCPGCEHPLCPADDSEPPLNPCAVDWEPSDVPGISYGTLAEPGLEFMRVEFGGDVTIHSRPLSACHGDLSPWELLLTIRNQVPRPQL